ncbi:MAG: protein kinase [Proteobacteria bacterium]|nr:protein kinase [Pseudomonadota bacterium]
MTFKPNIGDIVLNKYEILNFIGEGAFGSVYKAKDVKLERSAAIKFIHGTQGTMERFASEIEAIKRLEHPNIVKLYDFDLLMGNVPCLVMEFVQGRELGDILSTEGPFAFDQIAEIALQVTDALVETHKLGIIHCDLKPENIMLTSVGARTNVVKLIDFGVASLLTQSHSHGKEKALVGTPQYMAPEQIRRTNIGPWTDIYALGLILIELSTAQFVFDHEDMREILRKQLYETVILPHDLACTELGRITAKAVEKDSKDRYQSTLDFYNDLKSASQAMQTQAYWDKRQLNVPSHHKRERAFPSLFQYVEDGLTGDKINASAGVPLLNLSLDGHRVTRDDSDAHDRKRSSLRELVPLPGDYLSAQRSPSPSGPAQAPAYNDSTSNRTNIPHAPLASQEQPKASNRTNIPHAPLASQEQPKASPENKHTEPQKETPDKVDLGNLSQSLETLKATTKPAHRHHDQQQTNAEVSLAVKSKDSYNKLRPQQPKPPLHQKKRSIGSIILALIVFSVVAAGLCVLWLFHIKDQDSIDIPTQERDPAKVSPISRATLQRTASEMAYTAYISARTSAVIQHKTLVQYDIIGTPFNARIFVQNRPVCAQTPCVIHVFGDPSKVELKIQSNTASKTFLLGQHPNPSTPIILRVSD